MDERGGTVTVALLAVPVVLAVGAILVAAAPSPSAGARTASRTAVVATALAVLVGAAAVLSGPVVATVEVAGVPIGLAAGTLGATLVAFVAAMALVVLSYVERNLHDDPGQRRVAALGLAMGAGTTLVVAGGSLVVLAAGWIAVSTCALALVRHPSHAGSPRPTPRLRARTVVPVVGGDLALLTAVVLTTATWGHLRLPWGDTAAQLPLAPASVSLGSGGPTVDAAALVGVLLVVAALARAAAFPFHGWLVASLDAPSPVSALLHGGVVNAGGLLLVLTWPIVGFAGPGLWLAATGGGAAVLIGAVAMVVRPDVKGALVLSTVAQMGFVLVQVAVGLTGAAVLHCLTHGAYKAGRFLDAGRLAGHDAHGPARRGPGGGRSAVVATVATGAGGSLVLASVGGTVLATTWPLVPFALITAAVVAAGWAADRRPTDVVAVIIGGVAGSVAGLYLVAASAVEHALVGPVATEAAAVTGWALVALAPLGAAAVGLLRWASRWPALAPLADRAWAAAITLAQPAPNRPIHVPAPVVDRRAVPAPVPTASAALERSSA